MSNRNDDFDLTDGRALDGDALFALRCYPYSWATRQASDTRALLAKSPGGRSLMRLLSGDVEEREQRTLSEIGSLGHALDSDDPVRADEARRALNCIVFSAAQTAAAPLTDQEPYSAMANRIDAAVRATRRRLRSCGRMLLPDRLIRGLKPIWGWLCIVITLFAAIAMMTSRLGIALGLITVRVSLAIIVPSPALPADRSGRQSVRPETRGCVANHLADSLVTFASGVALVHAGLVVWGYAMFFVPMVTLGATLFRVASLQEGFWILRSSLERVARVGSSVVGIALAVALGGTDAELFGVFPALAIGGIGAMLFALEEIRVTESRLAQALSERRSLDVSSRRSQALAVYLKVVASDDRGLGMDGAVS